MKQYIDAGKLLANQYQETCSRILNITERMADEYEELYNLAYRARNMDMPDKNRLKSSPVEGAIIMIEKMRNEMDDRYCHEIAELEQKRMDMEGIITSSQLTAIESKVFYLRYGMRAKRLNLMDIADRVYYSERQVKRILAQVYGKVGEIL